MTAASSAAARLAAATAHIAAEPSADDRFVARSTPKTVWLSSLGYTRQHDPAESNPDAIGLVTLLDPFAYNSALLILPARPHAYRLMVQVDVHGISGSPRVLTDSSSTVVPGESDVHVKRLAGPRPLSHTPKTIDAWPLATTIVPLEAEQTKTVKRASVVTQDIPAAHPRTAEETSRIAPRFDQLADEWQRATRMLSSTQDKVHHSAYQRIMAMGKPALPLILRALRDQGGYWFWALAAIADEDVARGMTSYREARDAWLEWGRRLELLER
jgi:hypothetical protein